MADRSNSRIQIFTQDGTFVADWRQFGRPSGFYISGDRLYAIDADSSPANHPGWKKGIWVGSIEAQVRQTMRNLIDGLEEAGLGLADVVATNVYLDDMNDFAAMNRIYAQYFPARPPARTTVAQVAPVDRTARRGDTFPGLEQISLIAVKP